MNQQSVTRPVMLTFDILHGFTLQSVLQGVKDVDVPDGWYDSYPLGQHARVTIPVD